jgi:hypothetical protein
MSVRDPLEGKLDRLGEPAYFQVALELPGRPRDYLLDLDAESLIREVLLPIHLRTFLFIHGRETPAERLFAVRIVATTRKIQPEFEAWHERHGKGRHNPRDAFFTETQIFDVGPDVTNSLVHRFRQSIQRESIRPLLAEAQGLRAEHPHSLTTAQHSPARDRISSLSETIARLAGAFLAGYQNLP